MQQGIPIEKAREIVKAIKDSKKKVQASIQGDLVRVSGKDRDSLQEIIAVLRAADFGIDMQFTNYRSTPHGGERGSPTTTCREKSNLSSSPARPGAWKLCLKSPKIPRPSKPR